MKNRLDDHVAAYQGENLYDFDNEIILKWYPQRILKHCKGAGSMLELGLGHGFTTNIFSDHFSRHVVLDGSPAVIQNFKERFPQCDAEIIETYFENFQTDEKFDVIVMGFILEHVDDPLVILRHFRDFLAPGGRMFVAVPNAEVLNRKLGHLAGLLPDMQELSDHDRLLGHQRYYTVDSLSEDITKTGYVVKSMEGIYLKPLTTTQLLSLDLGENVIEALCLAAIDYPELSCGMLAEITLPEN
ncbi:MAG: class I SAM-dependent methyltransferase [Deltaproteobacteria bacterium]|nr:class I SAM-dependent methyltransferase [Deltaproteobacteria bacterium]